jgi:hypothetical protein
VCTRIVPRSNSPRTNYAIIISAEAICCTEFARNGIRAWCFVGTWQSALRESVPCDLCSSEAVHKGQPPGPDDDLPRSSAACEVKSAILHVQLGAGDVMPTVL